MNTFDKIINYESRFRQNNIKNALNYLMENITNNL